MVGEDLEEVAYPRQPFRSRDVADFMTVDGDGNRTGRGSDVRDFI
jgi:hypothetical protein